MRRLLLIAVTVAALVAAAPALAKTYDEGTILPGRGAAVGPTTIPVLIGMKKAKVLAVLGKPVYQNAFGYLQYSKKNLLDVYVNTSGNRVDLIGVSGRRFCLPFGICMLQAGGLKALKQKYGSALKREVDETGEVGYVFRNRVDGQKRKTRFTTDGTNGTAKIIMVFVSTG
ncbi:MAG: hypothetical protein R3C15_08115 [Thermoleophilia bacterium]